MSCHGWSQRQGQYPITIDTEDPALRSAFEDGSEQTRAKFTRQRRVWTLAWPALSTADRGTLSAFFITTRGGSAAFLWTDDDSNTHAVRFLTFKEAQKTPGLFEIQIQIKEI